MKKKPNIDEIDIKIITLLANDGRMSPARIAELVPDTSQRLIQYRIDRLISSETVHPLAIVDFSCIGIEITAELWLNVEAGKTTQVAKQLAEFAEFSYVASMIGRYDIAVTMHAKTTSELHIFLTKRMGAVKGIRELVVELSPKLLKEECNWRLPGSRLEESTIPPKSAAIKSCGKIDLSKTDRQIISHLQRNGRMKASEISRSMESMSSKKIRNRIQSYVEKGIIRFGAFIDPAKVGYPIRAAMGIKVNSDQIWDIVEELERLELVSYVAHALSGEDIIAGIYAKDITELHRLLIDVVQKIPGVIYTDTMIVAELYKDLKNWSILHINQCLND